VSTIVLVGVPGAGKTTVGKLLAKELAVSFFDSDQVIEARAGKSVSDIFTQDGEPAFRKLEHDVIVELLGSSNAVVALGGGSLGNDETKANCRYVLPCVQRCVRHLFSPRTGIFVGHLPLSNFLHGSTTIDIVDVLRCHFYSVFGVCGFWSECGYHDVTSIIFRFCSNRLHVG
jgi:hypothetical protein